MFGDLYNENSNDEDDKLPQLFSKNIKYKKFDWKFSERQRKNALETFLKLKSELDGYKSKIINESLALIARIHKITSEALKEVQIYRKNLDAIILQILNWEQMDKSQLNRSVSILFGVPSIDFSQFKTIFLPRLFINRIDLGTLPKFFTLKQLNFQEESRRFKPYSLNFVKGVNRFVTTYDAKRLKASDSSYLACQELEPRAAKCLLSDGNLFFHSKDKCLILYPFNYIRFLPSYKSSFLKACAIYIDGFVYLFGGLSAKFNINDERWSSLSVVPFEFGRYSICARFKNYILLSSWQSSNILYYDTQVDSYSEIPLNGLEKVAKAIFVKNSRAFLLEFSRFIYESDESLMAWNKVGKCINLVPSAPLISYSIEYKEKEYFANSYGVYSFDLKDKTIIRMLGYG